MISPTGKTIYLPPARPAAMHADAYRLRLVRLIDEMEASILYWVGACYRANEPELARLAADASPASALTEALAALRMRWQTRFDDLAERLSIWFAQSAAKRSDAALRAALRHAGFTVKFKMTRPMNDAYRAVISENVGLIKSIPSELLTQVEGHVMRSVQAGRNLGTLAESLQEQFGVTRRRAAFIALDQNNKATAVLSRVRYQELGITEAIWLHSGGGKEPRPTHLRAGRDRVRFDVAKGWFDPHENKWIHPGELPRCRCVSRPVIPGF